MASLNEYQKLALKFASYPEEYKVIYPALGITGESGEVSDKVKKLIRDSGYRGGAVDEDDRIEIAYELGDVLWNIAVMADGIGYSLDDIALMNVYKLTDRTNTGTISGSGDHRERQSAKEHKTGNPTFFETLIMILFMLVMASLAVMIWK